MIMPSTSVMSRANQAPDATPLEAIEIEGLTTTTNGVEQYQPKVHDDGTPISILYSDESVEKITKSQLDGGRRAWSIVLASFLLYFSMLGGTYSFGVYEAHYALHEFPGQSAKIALIGSMASGFSLVTSAIAGRWIESYGVRAVTIAGSIVFCSSLVAAGFCKTVPTLILTQGIFAGMGCGILGVPALIVMAPWFPNKRFLVLGIASSGAGLGGIFWSFATRMIISKLSYQWALWIMASTSAALFIIAIILIKSPPGFQRTPVAKRSYREGLKSFTNPKFLTLYIGNILHLFGYLVPFFFLATYAQTQLKSPGFVGAALSAVLNLGLSVGRIMLGFFANSSFGTMNTIVLSLAVAAFSQLWFWLPAANSLPLLCLFAFVYGFFAGGAMGIVPGILARIVDSDKLPTITGLFLSSNLPGAMAGGPIAGAILSSSHGKWSLVILYSFLVQLLGTFVILIARFQVERRIFATV